VQYQIIGFCEFLKKNIPLSFHKKLVYSPKINIPMDYMQMMDEARKMFLANKGRRDVIVFFQKHGVEESEAELMATDAYKSIRQIRQSMMEQAENQGRRSNGIGAHAPANSDSGSNVGAIISIILGAVICLGGLAASMGTNTIFYGAVLVGGMMFLRGIVDLAS